MAQTQGRGEEAKAALTNARSQRQQVKVCQTQVEAARGRLAQAMANLRQAELNLKYATVRAPVGGRVTKKMVLVFEPGENARHLLVPGMSVIPTINLR